MENTTTFTLDDVTYTRYNDTGYCYRRAGNRDVRISQNEFCDAMQEHDDRVDAELRETIKHTVEERENEETRQVQEEIMKTKKKHYSRKKKVQIGGMEFDIDGVKIILTPRQVEFVRHLPDSSFWERGVDSAVWIDILCDEIGGEFEGEPMTVGAMVSTMREKHLLKVHVGSYDNKRRSRFFTLTDVGKQVVAEILGV